MSLLGINHSNDAAAALVRQGRVMAACTEERFTRIKHDSRFPEQALRFVLDEAQTTLEECDAVAFFWNPLQHMDAAHRRLVATPRSHLEYLYSLPAQLWSKESWSEVPYLELALPRASRRGQRLFFINHHLCHAAHAFFESPFEQAAILTVDGYGERIATMIAVGQHNHISPVLEVPFPHSLGAVYAAITQYLGFKPNSGEGKVMGLAGYGEPRYRDLFDQLLWPTPDGFEVELSFFSYMMDSRYRFTERLVEKLGPPRQATEPLEPRHQDIAASLQLTVEDILVHLARLARTRTGLTTLCLAGGVALNCLANQRVIQEAGFSRCFIQPACHDAGTSAGAALYASQIILGESPGPLPIKTDYLGPSYDDAVMRQALEAGGLRFSEVSDPAEHGAERLARGRIVGRFAGRAEFGPRALGNRSILAPPGPAAVKEMLNARVKFREPFRPFAPSVPEECCATYFTEEAPSPYMLRVYPTRLEHLERLGAVTHVDGGARVQTVNAAENPAYLALIRAYGRLTGTDCLLNTSFNIRGEPIVQTPQDALKCFFTTDMDDLYLGPFHLQKSK